MFRGSAPPAERSGLPGRAGLTALADLALPRCCAACRPASQRPVCPGCADLVGLQVDPQSGPSRSRLSHRSPLSVAAAAPYEGPVRGLILHFKERGRTGARALLGSLLAEAVAALPATPCGQTRCQQGRPTRGCGSYQYHLRGRRSSGRDPVRELAGVAAATLRRAGLPTRVLPVLRCVRAVADQSGLSRAGPRRQHRARVRLPSPRLGGLVRARGARRRRRHDRRDAGRRRPGASRGRCGAVRRRGGGRDPAAAPARGRARSGAERVALGISAVARLAAGGIVEARNRGRSTTSVDWRRPSAGHTPVTAAEEARVEIVVKGRRAEVPERFREHVEREACAAGQVGCEVLPLDVELSRERNPRLSGSRHKIELTAHSRGPVIRAEAAAADEHAALDLAMARLEERMRRAADRRAQRHSPHVGRREGAPVSVREAAVVTARPRPRVPGRPSPR